MGRVVLRCESLHSPAAPVASKMGGIYDTKGGGRRTNSAGGAARPEETTRRGSGPSPLPGHPPGLAGDTLRQL